MNKEYLKGQIWKGRYDFVTKISIITTWDKKDKDFYVPGALIRVDNGRNVLSAKFSQEPEQATYCTLMFRDTPLFQFQGEEYFCPTCEKIVRSGYQLEQTEEFHIEKLNCENVPFQEAVEEITPLLGLLEDNYYVVIDTELYPTDGNGHLFWKVPNSDEPVRGSCLLYRGDGEWGLCRPHFTVATQSVEKLCESRVEYYRKHPDCRAVTYYMDGYMTALLDGHHKAMAAALEHRKVKALVIMPGMIHHYRHEDGSFKTYIVAGDMRFACDEYGVKAVPTNMGEKITFQEMQGIQKLIPDAGSSFPYDNDELASYYPTADEVAFIDDIGEISEERLDQIVQEIHICERDEICTLIRALGGLRHKRLFEMSDFFLKRCSYLSGTGYYDPEMFRIILEELMKLPRSGELEMYLIDIMVEYEDEYPTVGKMILEYL